MYVLGSANTMKQIDKIVIICEIKVPDVEGHVSSSAGRASDLEVLEVNVQASSKPLLDHINQAGRRIFYQAQSFHVWPLKSA